MKVVNNVVAHSTLPILKCRVKQNLRLSILKPPRTSRYVAEMSLPNLLAGETHDWLGESEAELRDEEAGSQERGKRQNGSGLRPHDSSK